MNWKLISGSFALVAILAVSAVFSFEWTKPEIGLGATGPDVISPYLRWGDVTEFRASQDITATSSVLCSIQAPAATSTLLGFTAHVKTLGGLLAAERLWLSTSTISVGSSTPFIGMVPAQANGDFVFNMNVASTSAWTPAAGQLVTLKDNGMSDNIIKPNVYLTLRTSSTTPGTFGSYPTGTCKARFQTLTP